MIYGLGSAMKMGVGAVPKRNGMDSAYARRSYAKD